MTDYNSSEREKANLRKEIEDLKEEVKSIKEHYNKLIGYLEEKVVLTFNSEYAAQSITRVIEKGVHDIK